MKQSDHSRRKFLKQAGLAGTGLALGSHVWANVASKGKRGKSLANKKVLFVYGGWKGHEPVLCRDLFVPWMESEGAEVTQSDTLEIYTDVDLMRELDLVVQVWTMGTIEKEQEAGLLEAVRSGCGIAGWHGGLGDSFRQNVKYQFMVGGQWVAHPGGVIDYKVNVVDHEDEVTRGIQDFQMHSEQYYMHVDPNVKVLATTTFSDEHADWIGGCIIPVVWKKVYGRGRVFYNSLGHVRKDFDVPENLEIMQRGIIWASRSRYEPMEEWKQVMYPGKRA